MKLDNQEKIIVAFVLIIFLSLFVSAHANWKDDNIVANANIKKAFMLFDPYPSKLNEFVKYIQENKYQYMVVHRVNADQLYCWGFFFMDSTQASDSWNQIKKTTGTAKSKLKDIGKDWNDVDLAVLLNE